MAPSRVAASQWARRTLARKSCRVTRVEPGSCQRSTFAPRKSCKSCRVEPELDSILPINQAGRKARVPAPSSPTSGSETGAAIPCLPSRLRSFCSNPEDDILELPFSDVSSPVFLPGIGVPVDTPPAWKSPYVVDLHTPRSLIATPEVPNLVCENLSSFCPPKTPSRVAKVFGELLPVSQGSPEKKEKLTKKVQRQGTKAIANGLRVMLRLSTAIGLSAKAEKRAFLSLADLRKHMLQRTRSLHKAFRDMEHRLMELKNEEGTSWQAKNSEGSPSNHSMSLSEFSRAIAFFGIGSQQARHFFDLMDKNGDGHITFEEFKSALVSMPREILILDFRTRLLTKWSSVHEAFKELSAAPGRRNKYADGDQTRPIDREAFAFHLSRFGVEEQEASLLFDIIDTDLSGTISFAELRETLREAAPEICLEEFWHRFNARWPEIKEAANGSKGRKRAAEMLFEILPAEHRGILRGDLPLSLSPEAFDYLCAELDVSQPNAEELFKQCATSKMWQGHRTSLQRSVDQLQVECDLDDFFDELQLWSQTPLARKGPGMRQSYGKDMAQRLGSIKAQLATV